MCRVILRGATTVEQVGHLMPSFTLTMVVWDDLGQTAMRGCARDMHKRRPERLQRSDQEAVPAAAAVILSLIHI